MRDIVERLNDIWSNDDHARGCQGRTYDCTCGFDSRTFDTAKEAADTIEALRQKLLAAEKALNWAMDEVDALSNKLCCFGYPQAMPFLHREDQAENYVDAVNARASLKAQGIINPDDGREEEFDRRLFHLHVEALAEIKATVDGESDQPVRDIICGLLDEIKALPSRSSLTGDER